jgi:hypothetical protein
MILPHSLEVIRICAHGSVDPTESPIQLGQGLTPGNAVAFESVRPLWHTVYDPEQRRSHYLTVVPRIEMHVCYAAMRGGPALRALATAARAPVFASYHRQTVPTSDDNFRLEGGLNRYDPVLSSPHRYPSLSH